MIRLASLALSVLCVLSLPAIIGVGAISITSSGRAIAKSKYTTSHSLGDSYTFDSRDGWQSFNATNLQYKYRRESTKKDSSKKTAVKHSSPLTIAQVLGKVWNGLKGMGKAQPVIATWYTGHDLLHPSCWSNTAWAPTDASFVCALTMQGWQNKPQCFQFLELCNTPQKCIFVRVVDTCAGCAFATHHVDLTRAAFGALAAFADGVVTIQSRPASNPNEWNEKLWGPEN
ncbi:hypothetical protein C8R43DRAFT_1117243 [Mycena crocata]|nr:hypothetical protein C8R43DRAFT_1117243 [Mycena crocata]